MIGANRSKLIIAGILIGIIAVSVSTSSFEFTNEKYAYVQSDITKANTNIRVSPAEYTLATTDISETKRSVVLTISGIVISIDEPIPWIDDAGNSLGYVPVTVEIDEKTKDELPDLKMGKGDQFTVYLGGVYEAEQYFLDGFEAQFEVGEHVILHVGKDVNGPQLVDDGIYFVELGKYGKYKVVDDKAFNEKHPQGKPVDKAFNESK